jgi:hypothetical protein
MARQFAHLVLVSETRDSLTHLRRGERTWCGMGVTHGWFLRRAGTRIVCAACRERAQEMGYR